MFAIDRADKVQVGDYVTVASHKAHEIRCMGQVKEISTPHPDITELKIRVMTHEDQNGEFQNCNTSRRDRLEGIEPRIVTVGLRHKSKVAIMRIPEIEETTTIRKNSEENT